MRVRGVVCCVLVLTAGVAQVSQAQTRLKLQGSNFAPIHQKALDAAFKFQGAFGTANLKLTYFNPAYQRTEADFLYTLPEGAVVTGFAYWYKHERVVARVVERERAEQIYKAIKSYRRDPALVEMVGKRTFRARIFPVEQRSDLRVELTLAMVAQNGAFTLPIKVEKGEALDTVHISVEGKAGFGVTNVANNLGLPESFSDGRYQMNIDEKKWRPDKDLRIGFKRSAPGLQASLYAARSAGSGGYFAMTIASSAIVNLPHVRIRGVATTEVHVSAPETLNPGQTVLVTGRFVGAGRATVELDGANFRQETRVAFSADSEQNNVATKLWASDEIESLGNKPKNAARSKAVSLQFSMPCPYTSWLAIPDSERKRFDLEIRAANAVVIADKEVERFLAGKKYRACLRDLSAKLAGYPDDVRNRALGELTGAAQGRLDDRIRAISQTWIQRVEAGKVVGDQEREDKTRITGYWNEINATGFPGLNITNGIRSSVDRLRERIVDDKVDRDGSDREVLRLKEWLKIANDLGSWPSIVQWSCSDDESVYERSVVATGDPTQDGLAKRRNVEKVGGWLGVPTGWANGSSIQREVRDLANTLGEGVIYGREDQPGYQELRLRLVKIAHVFPVYNADTLVLEATRQGATAHYSAMLQDLGNLVRKFGKDDPRTVPTFKEVTRLRTIAGKTGNLGDENWSSWSSASADLMREIGEKYAESLSVEDARKDIESQVHRIEDAGFRLMYQALQKDLDHAVEGQINGIVSEEDRPNPDENTLAILQKRLTLFSLLTHKDGQFLLKEKRSYHVVGDSRRQFMEALRETPPDSSKVNQTREKFRDDNPDFRGDEWINWRIERIETDVMLDKLEKEPRTPEVEKQITELRSHYEELHVRMGDPLIRMRLPIGTVRAVVRLPWGEFKDMRLMSYGLWEARFDIPTYILAGTYAANIWSETGDGKSTESSWTFVVDLTPPTLRCAAHWVDGRVILDANGPQDLARVKVIVPWGNPVDGSQIAGGKFSATLDPTADWEGGDLRVIGFDKAHNRSEVVVHVPARR